ncbi:MAG: molecular chaperone SurA [Betaproteobacteria bacterium]|nr:molecular chaperone SurA [Betaproteobacteria bacterium]
MNSFVTRIPLLFVFTWCLLATTAKAADPIALDRVVAIVNTDVITQLELDDQVRLATRELNRQGTPLPDHGLLEKQILERMITTRVLLQYAKETGLRVDESQVDRALDRIAKESGIPASDLPRALKSEGIDYDRYREDIKGEITISRLRDREVESRVNVSEAEIEAYLKSQQAAGRNDEYKLMHILVTVPEAASPEQVQTSRARAEEALEKIRSGADFIQISATYSDAPNALKGGELDWRPIGRLPTIFAQALTTMSVGDVSDLLRSPNGFHIIKLVDKRSNVKPVVVEQTHARHILIRLNEIVSADEAKRRLEAIRKQVLAGGDFQEFARAQSDDASAAKGGDLGWLSPGDTVPEFEQAMDALKPGEISEPVQTPFGWHLIQVVARRTEDMTKERERRTALLAIRARKSDEAFTDWVRQQRDRAFVEIHLSSHGS